MLDSIITSVLKAINVRKCPVCESQDRWEVGPSIGLIGTYDPSDKSVNPLRGKPVVHATCEECGHVLFLTP